MELEKYISIINFHLNQKEGEENLDELKELFTTEEFIKMIKEQRMDIYFENERKNKKNNAKVCDYFIKALEELLRSEEAGNQNIEFFYFYLKEKKAKKENRKLLLIIAGIMLGVIVGYWVLHWSSLDIVLRILAPSKSAVCKEIENQYDVEVSARDITLKYHVNDDYKTKEKYPKLVLYTIPVVLENEEISFSGKWIPFEEVSYDLESVLLQSYLEDQGLRASGGRIDNTTLYCDLRVNLLTQEDKQLLLKQLNGALQEIFNNKYITDRFNEYAFQITLREDYYDKTIYLTVKEENFQETMEKFSRTLDSVLAIIEDVRRN